jgi:hypothetical protein
MGFLADLEDAPGDAWDYIKRGGREVKNRGAGFENARPEYGPEQGSPMDYGGGAEGSNTEIDRYRKIGENAANRKAYQLQFGAADANRANNLQAHTQQAEASDMLGTAAAGGAPSRAAIDGGQVAGNAFEDALAAGAGARGAAYAQARSQSTPGQAAQIQARNTLAGADQSTVGRAQELSRARGAYGQSGTTMRAGDVALQGQDQSQAEAQGDMEMAQRRRNDAMQHAQEQMGIDVGKSTVDAEKRKRDIMYKAEAAGNAAADAERERQRNVFHAVVDTGKTAYKLYSASDKGAKTPASLNDMRKRSSEMLGKVKAQNDTLKYGPSVSDKSAEDGDEGDVNDTDVNAIRYGTEPYDRSVFKSRDEGLHRGIEDALAKGDQRERALQQAREDRDQDIERNANDAARYKDGAPGTEDDRNVGKLDDYSKRVSTSDNRAKLAAAWDEGHAAAVSDVGKLAKMPAADLKKRSEPAAAILRDAKAGAWDEGHGTPVVRPAAAPEAPLAFGQKRNVESPRPAAVTQAQRANPLGQRAMVANGEARESLGILPQHDTSGEDIVAAKKNATSERLQDLRDQEIARDRALATGRPMDNSRQLNTGGRKTENLTPTVPEAARFDRKGEDESLSDESAKTASGDTTGGSVEDPELQRDANRKLRGETYRYKDGFGEETERVHHGFMAQNLQENPITNTAVRDDDGTGVLKVDNTDALRVTAAGVAQLQEDNDQMRGELDKLLARRGRR